MLLNMLNSILPVMPLPAHQEMISMWALLRDRLSALDCSKFGVKNMLYIIICSILILGLHKLLYYILGYLILGLHKLL